VAVCSDDEQTRPGPQYAAANTDDALARVGGNPMTGQVRTLVQWTTRTLGVVVVLVVWMAMAAPAHASGTTLYVDQNNPNCSNTGAGTQSSPFCTIQAGASHAVAGTTVQVATGTYREKVTVPNSGSASAPIVLQAAPGATVTVTGQANGFAISTKSWITVQGFAITATSSYGISVQYSSNITITGNHVSYSGQPVSGQTAAGIYVKSTNDSRIANNVSDHNTDGGIYVHSGSTRDTIAGNKTFANARGYTRAAPGIDVRSSGNTVEANISHNNEDSGIQFYNGGGAAIVRNNVCYHNGDHGIDNLNSPNQVIVANTVYGNTTAGINVEGTPGTAASSGATLANNISVDNALTNTFGQKGNIRVDVNSVPGTTINYDQVFLTSSGTMFNWNGKTYSSLAALVAATGQEGRGIQADPQWTAAASGDFHLLAGSPAIDSANSGVVGQPAVDIEGNSRVDDPATANTGTGPRKYDDRGAYEFQPA
jgi:parallel beta-helix repeat protein